MLHCRSNGRNMTAWWPGCRMHPELHRVRPQGFDWSPNPADPAAAAAAAAVGGPGVGPVDREAIPRLPVQYKKPLPSKGDYCFKSPAWSATKFKPVVLKQPYRQVGNDCERLGSNSFISVICRVFSMLRCTVLDLLLFCNVSALAVSHVLCCAMLCAERPRAAGGPERAAHWAAEQEHTAADLRAEAAIG